MGRGGRGGSGRGAASLPKAASGCKSRRSSDGTAPQREKRGSPGLPPLLGGCEDTPPPPTLSPPPWAQGSSSSGSPSPEALPKRKGNLFIYLFSLFRGGGGGVGGKGGRPSLPRRLLVRQLCQQVAAASFLSLLPSPVPPAPSVGHLEFPTRVPVLGWGGVGGGGQCHRWPLACGHIPPGAAWARTAMSPAMTLQGNVGYGPTSIVRFHGCGAWSSFLLCIIFFSCSFFFFFSQNVG